MIQSSIAVVMYSHICVCVCVCLNKAVGSNFELIRFLHKLAIRYLLLADTYLTIDQNVFFSTLYSLSCSKSMAQDHVICFIIKNPLVSRGV